MAYVIFTTDFGACALACRDAVVTGFQLPGPTEALTDARISKGAGERVAEADVPAWIGSLLERVRLHLRGTPQDFTDVPIDWSLASDFQVAVYRRTLQVKAGCVASYGEISASIGLGPEAARAVGVALASNRWPLLVPCHRVVSAGGKMTGFSAPGGIRTKTRLLALEGAELLSE
jgi:methylated-DNA-[protein]-cysteine S-methyltransferase